MLPARFSGIRIRILAIALIPSVALLAIGVVLAVYLADQGQHAKNFSKTFDKNLQSTSDLILAAEQERMQSLWQLTGNNPDPQALGQSRARFDSALQAIAAAEQDFATTGGSMNGALNAFDTLKTQLPQLRAGIDAGSLPIGDAYHFYSALLDHMDASTIAVAENKNVPDPTSTLQLLQTISLLHVVEANSRAAALTAAAAGPVGLPPALFDEFRNQVGFYRTSIGQVPAGLEPALAQQLDSITKSQAWQQMGTMEDALLRPQLTKSGTPLPLPMSVNDWRAAASQVNQQLVAVWVNQNKVAQDHAIATADTKADNSLLSGGAMAAVAVVAFALSLLLANRLIGRLRRLRTETLALAEVQLPETVRKLAVGEPVDPEKDFIPLQFGSDEIGSVATAFNRAHTAAIRAAVTEARTRQGVRAVFLNIAHRSQVVVHRQLEILDEAERAQEDPAQLEIFFRLDHLATRERRNAENLIVLSGGQPGRKWRRPVALIDLVRSAVAETLDYARVDTGRMPQLYVIGTVVADLIHLLAELVDNATSFSSPQSRVELTGTAVGKGVAIEINDQGMGMAPEELDLANTMLADPPDFGVAALSADSRLGLFVVAQLGVRHGISVRLSDSVYGGVRAVVLLPNSLVTAQPVAVDALPQYLAGRRTDMPPTTELPVRRTGALTSSRRPQIEPAAPVATLPPAAPPRPQHDRREPPVPDAPSTEPPRREPPRHTSPLLESPLPEQSPRAEYLPADPPSSATAPDRNPPRPALPRRRKQASLAPELANHQAPEEDSGPRHARSADAARDLMSAIENGTRQGRRAEPDPYPSSHMSGFPFTDE